MAYAMREFAFNSAGEDLFSCTVIYDFQGFGIANLPRDLSMLFLTLSCYECLPARFERLILHGLPWGFGSIIKGMVLLAPANYRSLVNTTTNKTIHKYVSQENLPDFMANGCSQRNYLKAPPDGKCSTFEVAMKRFVPDPKKHSWATKTIKKFLDQEGLPSDHIPTIDT